MISSRELLITALTQARQDTLATALTEVLASIIIIPIRVTLILVIEIFIITKVITIMSRPSQTYCEWHSLRQNQACSPQLSWFSHHIQFHNGAKDNDNLLLRKRRHQFLALPSLPACQTFSESPSRSFLPDFQSNSNPFWLPNILVITPFDIHNQFILC